MCTCSIQTHFFRIFSPLLFESADVIPINMKEQLHFVVARPPGWRVHSGSTVLLQTPVVTLIDSMWYFHGGLTPLIWSHPMTECDRRDYEIQVINALDQIALLGNFAWQLPSSQPKDFSKLCSWNAPAPSPPPFFLSFHRY
jgi:hypothetical protein